MNPATKEFSLSYANKKMQRAHQRAWMRKRRLGYIMKLGGKCRLCASKKGLQFDHINPKTKTCAIGGIWSRTAKVIEAELAKCQLLCALCHKKKTAEERITDHGTRGRYGRGCRCDVCRTWLSKANWIKRRINRQVYCADCNVQIDKRAKRCKKCASKNRWAKGSCGVV